MPCPCSSRTTADDLMGNDRMLRRLMIVVAIVIIVGMVASMVRFGL